MTLYVQSRSILFIMLFTDTTKHKLISFLLKRIQIKVIKVQLYTNMMNIYCLYRQIMKILHFCYFCISAIINKYINM